MPFRLVKTQYLDCQYGQHYYKEYERKSSRVCLQSTRKVGCPPHLVIKEFEVFPQFCPDVDGLTPRATRQVKEDKLSCLKIALAEHRDIQTERRYHVSLPTNEAHQQYPTGTVAGMVQKISPMVSEKIEELVKEGYSDVGEVQRYLDLFVKSKCTDHLPDRESSRNN